MRRLGAMALAAVCTASLALAQNSITENWVATWTTAQQLVAPTGPPRPARQKGPEASNLPASLADQTVRMVAHVSLGGRRVRVELSNMVNAQPLEVGAAHVATAKSGGEIVDGTDRVLKFGGSASFTIPSGAIAVSDSVDLEVAAFRPRGLTVSFSRHWCSRQPHGWITHSLYLERERNGFAKHA
jgi:hypothetical protein